MIYWLVLLASLVCFRWLVKRDNSFRTGISSALWIPTLWVGIMTSRPLSMWLGFGGGSSTMEGSPADALFYFLLIFAGLNILVQRRLNWGQLVVENWAVFLFYGFLLVSVLWANSPFVSFKRWFKEFGNIVMVLVILTEANPQQALRAVFARCAYLLLPLSLIFIRYFPDLGRFYSRHGGQGEMIGVTTQKNSLGVLILVCGLVLLWDLLQLRQEQAPSKKLRNQTLILGGLLLLGAHLLYISDSKTSMLCLAAGGLIIILPRLPFFRYRIRMITVVCMAAALLFWVADELFGIKEDLVGGLGRDMTFTGRTEVWRVLLSLGTDPVFGVGFMSFWDDPHFQSLIPVGSGVAKSAHSGYVEQYLTGGWVGIVFLAVMLLGVGLRINRNLIRDGDYGALRFAALVITLVANFSESNFACMTPVGFLFLIAAIGAAPGFAAQRNRAPEARSAGTRVRPDDDFSTSPAFRERGY